jgi:hypothetical protein
MISGPFANEDGLVLTIKNPIDNISKLFNMTKIWKEVGVMLSITVVGLFILSMILPKKKMDVPKVSEHLKVNYSMGKLIGVYVCTGTHYTRTQDGSLNYALDEYKREYEDEFRLIEYLMSLPNEDPRLIAYKNGVEDAINSQCSWFHNLPTR